MTAVNKSLILSMNGNVMQSLFKNMRKQLYSLLSVCMLLGFSYSAWAVPVNLVIEKAVHKHDQVWQQRIQQSDAIKEVVGLINENIVLKEQLTIRFGADDGPLFDPNNLTIQMPYAFLQEVTDRFNSDRYGSEGVDVETALDDVLMHTLLHELAHALIEMYDLPVLGKEEDASDSLANVLLLEMFNAGGEIVLSAADLFDLESTDRDSLEEADFWDEHSLDEQRYYSAVCAVYGHDPRQYQHIVEGGLLAPERAELCIDEYEKSVNDWMEVLGKYWKGS